MQQRVHPGAALDILTPDEALRLLDDFYARTVTYRVRAAGTVALDANGNGTEELYSVPLGMEFEARRVTLDISGASDPSTGNVALNVAGKFVAYQRSGARIEYAVPLSPNSVPQVPGVQTWGDEQGPYLRNGEVFEIAARGLTANGILFAIVEGILRRPPAERSDRRGAGARSSR